MIILYLFRLSTWNFKWCSLQLAIDVATERPCKPMPTISKHYDKIMFHSVRIRKLNTKCCQTNSKQMPHRHYVQIIYISIELEMPKLFDSKRSPAIDEKRWMLNKLAFFHSHMHFYQTQKMWKHFPLANSRRMRDRSLIIVVVVATPHSFVFFCFFLHTNFPSPPADRRDNFHLNVQVSYERAIENSGSTEKRPKSPPRANPTIQPIKIAREKKYKKRDFFLYFFSLNFISFRFIILIIFFLTNSFALS